jgi:hypothetical protein
MNYASIANKLISKSGPAIRKAGEKLGAFLLRPQGAAQRIARDTLAYTAAEQGVPRLLGVQAPPIEETLIRQAGGNIVAEGVTAGLGKAFPGTGAMIAYKKGGQQYFRPSGIDLKLARGIGEVTGQIAGKQLAQSVLPGNQQYPFLNTSQGKIRDRDDAIAELSQLAGVEYLGKPKDLDPALKKALGNTENLKGWHKATLQADGTYNFEASSPTELQATRPGHPVSPTGAIPASYEPESSQVQRRSSEDLIYQKQLDAQLDREHYLNRIALANAQNQPRTITQRVEQDPQKSAMAALHEGYKVQRYG